MQSSNNDYSDHLNETQQYFLAALIGEGGILSETIDDSEFDNGTKILYLERAISLEKNQLNYFLDKLFTEDTSFDESKNLDLVNAFKKINDLYFNNKVIVHKHHPNKPALDIILDRFGPFNLETAQNSIKNFTIAIINKIKSLDPDNVEDQKAQRLIAEENIIGSHIWRNKLGIPKEQRINQNDEEEDEELNLLIQEALNIYNNLEIGAEIINNLTEQKQYIFLNYPQEIAYFIENFYFLDDLLEVPDDTLLGAIENFGEFRSIILESEIDPIELISIEKEQLEYFLDNHIALLTVLNNTSITLAMLTKLSKDDQELILNNAHELSDIIYINSINIKDEEDNDAINRLLDRIKQYQESENNIIQFNI